MLTEITQTNKKYKLIVCCRSFISITYKDDIQCFGRHTSPHVTVFIYGEPSDYKLNLKRLKYIFRFIL